ncbi:MAG: efflux RND transporter periplasmic adaptor subunit [Gammaproteobacteria bacterium]|jgi:multidrug efflux system membrane fusion protein
MTLRNNTLLCVTATIVIFMSWAVPAYTAEIDSTLEWHQKTVLSTPVSGVIKSVNVSPGAVVNKGDVLLQLDDRALRENVEKAQAEVERQGLLEEEAQRELDRTIELYEQTLIADHEKQLAIIAHSEAQASHKAAKAALVQAQMDLEYSAVRAPYDAVVIKQLAQVGQTIASITTITPLVEVAERGMMSATVQVSGRTVDRLKLGDKVKVKTGGKVYNGAVESIGLEPVSAKSSKYAVRVAFPTRGKVLRAGQSAKVTLP